MDRETRRKLFGLFVVATLTALLVRMFVVENFRIASDSMVPNLLTGDLVLVSKFDYSLHLPFSSYEVVRLRRPRVGEIIALGLPGKSTSTFVKRVIATEGDRVSIREGVLYVNDHASEYTPVTGTSDRVTEKLENGNSHELRWDRENARDFGPVDIPPGHFFVLGDNRNESVDSRTWGPIPYSFITGKVRFIWLSVQNDSAVRPHRIARWVP